MKDERIGRYADEAMCKIFLEEHRADCCLNCKYFERHDRASVSGFEQLVWVEMTGDCRRRSPASSIEDGDCHFPVWPTVNTQDWCGEFERTTDERGLAYMLKDLKQSE